MQSSQPRTANCGGGTGTIVNGVIYLNEDYTFTKIDINTTPSGSAVCGFSGGSWARTNATTLTLSWSVAGVNPSVVTVSATQLTFPTGAVYNRRT